MKSKPGPGDWELVIAIPAANFKKPVEAGHAAIVGPDDDRYKAICSRERTTKTFLESFRSPFGERVNPAIVIRHKKRQVDAYDLVALRNIVALAAVVKSRMERCLFEHGDGPPYSDVFEFCPINVRRDGKGLFVETGAERGLDDLKGFRGQITPAFAYPHNLTVEFDEGFLGALLKLWRRTPRKRGDTAFRRRLLRALEVAYHAMVSPFTHLRRPTDLAFRVSLWVPALEILTNSGPGQGSQAQVAATIRAVPWRHKELQRPVKSIHAGQPQEPIPIRTLQRVYKVRHKTLHGDAIPWKLMVRSESPRWNDLSVEAPILFRFAVLSVLSAKRLFHFPPDDSKLSWPKGWTKWLGAIMDQRRCEEPLFTNASERRKRAKRAGLRADTVPPPIVVRVAPGSPPP